MSPTPGSSSSRESSLDPNCGAHHVIHTTSVLSTRSPRQILIQRSEDGFGFTLRHFIVYPPDDPSLEANNSQQQAAAAAAGVDIKEPLDTIFVKSVREGGPAHSAGLQCGDRIISVNGESVSGKTYAEVVGLIQRLRDNLSLIVVPKQDDILQMYFSDIAQNPETNQRPARESFSTVSPALSAAGGGYFSPGGGSSAASNYIHRESSPFTEFVNNGPTRIAMPRVPEPILPPWHQPQASSEAQGSTEHVYAMPARIVMSSGESLEAHQHDPRSIGSLVSLNSNSSPAHWRSQAPPQRTESTIQSNDCDPVINRIKRDFERKQEFLRTTNLPNYVGSPVTPPSTQLSSSDPPQPSEPFFHGSKAPPAIVQQEERRPPVYFGDRFPVHQYNQETELDGQQQSSRAGAGQFHLYGLQLGYRRSGRQFDEDEIYAHQQQQQQQQVTSPGQALSHHHQLQHHHYYQHQVQQQHQQHHPYHHQQQQQSNSRTNNLQSTSTSQSSSTTYQTTSQRQQLYLNAHYDGSNCSNNNNSSRSNGPVVLRRKKKQNLDDEEERNLRRVSYLRATKEDRMHIDSDAEAEAHQHAAAASASNNLERTAPATATSLASSQHVQNSEQPLNAPSTPKHSTSEGGGGDVTPRHAHSIQRIRALFGDKAIEEGSASSTTPSGGESLREGWLHCKVTAIAGKKSVDRSWRNVYAVLTADSLNAYKDKKTAAENQLLSFEEVPHLILSESGVEIADDYTKRKHVFRVKTEAGSEVLFQVQDGGENAFQSWLNSLEQLVPGHQFSRARKLTSAPVAAGSGSGSSSNRNRSPTGHSPATKNRKASADQGPMTKEGSNKKTWKGKVAKQWKRMQASGSSPALQNTESYPEGGSIGVPLEDCPMCPDSECIPMLVTTCCRQVEEKGLDIVGIYRVPGNSAAVNALTEQVNSRGEECFVKLDDPKWNDVNVVTSLLKSFFRKLPDPLFTTEMYQTFIEASKIEENHRRLNHLRKFIRDLPGFNYETLHHLCQHLVRVVDHCETNKMEIRNLAIVFGPTLVRPADDNMLSMVTDMSHQCRIIESILTNFDWFFSEDEEDFDEDLDTEKQVNANTNQVLSQNFESESSTMELVKLTGDSGTSEANHNLLLSNLQKLEDAGKMLTSSSHHGKSDVSAKDIVSGIISAANRKMLRAATGTGSSSGSQQKSSKKDSTGSNNDKSKLDSRRNSESVFQGAVAIATAVPQLMVNAGNSMSTSNLPNATSSSERSEKVGTSSASQENLITNAESTVMSSSTSRIVSTASYYDSEVDSSGKKIKTPIDTYKGLEKATAERVRRFEDETKANLLRGRLESSPNLSSSRTTSDAHVETWTNDLAGGILFQDDPIYPVHHGAIATQDRFVNLTYRSPSVIKTPERLLHPHQQVHHHLNQPQSPRSAASGMLRGNLTRGLSLGELNPRSQMSPLDFDTAKIATQGTLKRLKLVKSPTDTQLFVPNHVLLQHQQQQQPQPNIELPSESMLTSLTADFDEKMKLLLDPHYSGGSAASDTSSSVQSTPSKYAKLRRVSEQPPSHYPQHQAAANSTNHNNNKTNRSISLGEDSQNVCSEKQLSILSEQQQRMNKKSELKRGRLVDKNHPPKAWLGNESENEIEKENKDSASAEAAEFSTPKSRVKLRNNRRLRRRHTVGGTKDFADIDINDEEMKNSPPDHVQDDQESLRMLQEFHHPALSQYHHSVMMNVDRSLSQWIRRQQKIGKSSPDLSIIGRRLSLPDSVLANSAAFYPFTSLLESQV